MFSDNQSALGEHQHCSLFPLLSRLVWDNTIIHGEVAFHSGKATVGLVWQHLQSNSTFKNNQDGNFNSHCTKIGSMSTHDKYQFFPC